MRHATSRRHLLRGVGSALALTLLITAVPMTARAHDPVAIEPIVAAPILPLPVGKKLTAFSKNAEGATAQANVAVKICHGQITEEMSNLYLRVKVEPGPCDEGFSRQVLNGYLIASTNIIRRRPDRRGCFDGSWRLVRPDGTVLAAGQWSGTVGVGTHRPPGTSPCESCSEPEHYEGKLKGRVVLNGPYYGAEICATLAGTGPLQPNTPQKISFEGVVISECLTVAAANLADETP